jgi:hypothetical protein
MRTIARRAVRRSAAKSRDEANRASLAKLGLHILQAPRTNECMWQQRLQRYCVLGAAKQEVLDSKVSFGHTKTARKVFNELTSTLS